MNASGRVAVLQRRTVIVGIFLALLALISLNLVRPQLAAASQISAFLDEDAVYFEETGQIVSGPILLSWLDHGGLDRTGFPVTMPKQMGDRWVQWFEYARLEIVGVPIDQAAPEDVTVAPVGSLYASKMGYQSSHPAFVPVDGPIVEGAEFFADSGHSVANGFLHVYRNDGNTERFGLPISEELAIGNMTYQFFEYGAFSWAENEDAVLVPIGTLDAVMNNALNGPQPYIEGMDVYEFGYFMRSEAFAGERWILIDLSDFTLTALVGDMPVLSTLVVVGAAVSPTVIGEFEVYWKLESQTMEGVGWDGSHYRQPDVPYVMYFFEDWAIHGAYWRNGFGYAASHGCVNVPVEQSAFLWGWASVGTRVVVQA